MIYKNFYNKYKMSTQIKKDEIEKLSNDIQSSESVMNVLEKEEDKTSIIKPIEDVMDPEAEIDVIEQIDELDKVTKEQPNKEILLKLGDIILISDPSNEILNNNVFLIEYIDRNKIKLINSQTFEKTILQISPEGLIGDGNIQSITVISSNPENGYARQNGLMPGSWINIYFGGEIPTVITGKITNLEEDMIEIRTTDDDTIFINFAFF